MTGFKGNFAFHHFFRDCQYISRLGIVDQRIGGHLECFVRGLLQLEYLGPHTETNIYMRSRRDKGFEDIGVGANHVIRYLTLQARHRVNRRSLLPEEHSATKCEMQVVNTVQRIKVFWPGVGLELVINLGCGHVA